MRALVQRVSSASVTVAGDQMSAIGPGLLVLLGIRDGDTGAEADRVAAKVRALRVFPDADGKLNEPLGDREILCVSQVTFYGDTQRGNRPSFITTAHPEQAEPLDERVCQALGAGEACSVR